MFQAECFADHALTYLSTMVDDVALVMALATELNMPETVDSMGKLRSCQDHPTLTPVRTLLEDLNQHQSWWQLGFLPKKGARQLLIHNQYLVHFHGSANPGELLKVHASLQSPAAGISLGCSDFFDLLREILTDLFDWLDRLELALTNQLREKSSGWSLAQFVRASRCLSATRRV